MEKCPVHLPFFILLFLLFAAPGFSSAATRLKLVDEVGREVVFAFPPKRIVSLAPNISEILFSLGLDREIVGVSSQSDYPKEAKRKTQVGSYLNPDLEKIVSLKPDLVIATGAGNTRDIVDRLGKLDLPVYVIFPKKFDDILESIVHLGRVVDRREEARWIVRRMERRRDRVLELTRGLYRPRVLLLVGEFPIVTAGRGSFADDLIRIAAGENISGNSREMYPRLSMEEVLQKAPEVITISTMSAKREYGKVLQDWGRWKTIPAVRDNRIYVIDSDLIDRPSPRIIEGLEQIARLLHPEVFGK